MDPDPSVRLLSEMTDPGLFERLATAVLRESNPLYEPLAHLGVNEDGQTVKGPSDGVSFTADAAPKRMIVVHHTICEPEDLEGKWLHNPLTVKPYKGRTKGAAPPGDLLKAIEKIELARQHIPALKATLVLTTNSEPAEDLILAANAKTAAHDIDLDLWTRSRLAGFLDNKPNGHWLRKQYFGVTQELLSPKLFEEICEQNLRSNRPSGDEPSLWVDRSLDDQIDAVLTKHVAFIVSESGMGKSVGCYKWLLRHKNAGGLSLIVSHQSISEATSIEHIIDTTLRQFHPMLANTIGHVLSYCSQQQPIALVVEDINRSGHAEELIERILKITCHVYDEEVSVPPYRLLCPIWPQIIGSLSEQNRTSVETRSIYASALSPDEGRRAVQQKALVVDQTLSDIDADQISQALGHDPLLIALHDLSKSPDSRNILDNFANSSLKRTARLHPDHPSADYLTSLQKLAAGMLKHRILELSWDDAKDLLPDEGDRRLVSHVAHYGEIMRFTDSATNQRILFRHDRVRDWLLVNAATSLGRKRLLDNEIIDDPYFAEIIGAVLNRPEISTQMVERVAKGNPLALFFALKIFGEPISEVHRAVTAAISDWLDAPETQSRANDHLRLTAGTVLADTDSSKVLLFANRLRGLFRSPAAARLRNGDVSGGIEICHFTPPQTISTWRDSQIEHAKLHFGEGLIQSVAILLADPSALSAERRIGAIRLAGYLADPTLGPPIESCWHQENDRDNHLNDYLWALSRCCGEDAQRYLGPVCDAWARLPEEIEVGNIKKHPRAQLTHVQVNFAFRQHAPSDQALQYFAERAQDASLRDAILNMMQRIDHPTALRFVVENFASRDRAAGEISRFARIATEPWRGFEFDESPPMSTESHALLLLLWQNEDNDIFTRFYAFIFWATAARVSDLQTLRSVPLGLPFGDDVLRTRLRLGDQEAIPQLLEKLNTDGFHWLQSGRHLWSPELTRAVDVLLSSRDQIPEERGERSHFDSLASDMIARNLTSEVAEFLLLKHWIKVKNSPDFIQTALFVASASLVEKVTQAVTDGQDPRGLFRGLEQGLGIKTNGRPGLTRPEQIMVLLPFLDLIDPGFDLQSLGDECNKLHLFDLRREHIDPKLLLWQHKIWTIPNAYKSFDQMVTNHTDFFIEHWLEEYLAAGISRTEILETMADWVRERKSMEAMSLFAFALSHFGKRVDTAMLQIHEGMDRHAAEQLIRDTEFAVRRRTLE